MYFSGDSQHSARWIFSSRLLLHGRDLRERTWLGSGQSDRCCRYRRKHGFNGASQITQGGTNTGDNITAVRNLFTYDDHFSIMKGIHQIEGGVWFQQVQANDNLAQYQWGRASFSNLQSFLQGSVSTFTVAPSRDRAGLAIA